MIKSVKKIKHFTLLNEIKDVALISEIINSILSELIPFYNSITL